jgi:hypothetical protein
MNLQQHIAHLLYIYSSIAHFHILQNEKGQQYSHNFNQLQVFYFIQRLEFQTFKIVLGRFG